MPLIAERDGRSWGEDLFGSWLNAINVLLHEAMTMMIPIAGSVVAGSLVALREYAMELFGTFCFIV
jgi:hypothetical protein